MTRVRYLTEEMLLFLVGIDFLVLVGNALFLQGNLHLLVERTELGKGCVLSSGVAIQKTARTYPSRPKSQVLGTLVLCRGLRSTTSSNRMDLFVWDTHVISE
jgi:hypothetical protein